MPGLFISFEGLDGCGKSTQMQLAAEYLQKKGIDPVLTREPGGTGISEQIRSILLNAQNESMDPWTEALLYAASRRQHVRERILPALRDNRVVLTDRFVDSSIAYQGYGRELGPEAVRRLNAPAVEGCMPDLTFFFDCPAGLSAERRKESGGAPDRVEHSGSRFFERVYAGFVQLCEKEPDRFIRIDASDSCENTHAQVQDALEALLRRKGYDLA